MSSNARDVRSPLPHGERARVRGTLSRVAPLSAVKIARLGRASPSPQPSPRGGEGARNVAAFCAAVLLSSAFVHAAPIDDAKGQFEGRDYRGALKTISAALVAPNGDTESQADLFQLRGECLLYLKSRGGAIDAFRAAERLTGDAKKSCAAAATQLLIEDSAGFTYTSPRGGQTFDVRDPAARRQAMAVMFADRFEEIKPATYRESAGGTLASMRPLLPELADVYALEVAATGKDETIKPLLSKIADRARGLVAEEIARLGHRVELIGVQVTDASVLGDAADQPAARELTARQRQELDDLSRELQKLDTLCAKLRVAMLRTGGPTDAWSKLGGDCRDLLGRINELHDRR